MGWPAANRMILVSIHDSKSVEVVSLPCNNVLYKLFCLFCNTRSSTRIGVIIIIIIIIIKIIIIVKHLSAHLKFSMRLQREANLNSSRVKKGSKRVNSRTSRVEEKTCKFEYLDYF